MRKEYYCAVDLGATSGRVIIAPADGGEMEEVRRFPHGIKEREGKCFWDIDFLVGEITAALRSLAERDDVRILSVGVDTWGVDMAFLDEEGRLLAPPRAYRDPYTEGMVERYAERMPLDKVYMKTGIQIMPLNTLFQLFACHETNYEPFLKASHYLFMPDYLNYVLSGRMACEYTILSTSQFLDPFTKQIDRELIEAAGARMECFPEIVYPGTKLGKVRQEIARFPYDVDVVTIAGHDTASAVATVPEGNVAYLSSGTWSLLGMVRDEPFINERSRELNLTNEGGVGGKTCVMSNITGMWILEQCRKEWKAMGKDYGYGELMKMFDEAAGRAVFNPDDKAFANPPSMLGAIREYSKVHGLYVPQTDAEIVRSIFESLAARYKTVFDWLQELVPEKIERLYVIGGGARNSLLNSLTEKALGIPVVVGAIEATAEGNVLIQKKAHKGEL